MSNSDFGALASLLVLLVGTAHLFGYLFARLQQPRVVGEILAGVCLGPVVLGQFAPQIAGALADLPGAAAGRGHSAAILDFFYSFGLLLLMFISGAETKGLFGHQDRRQVLWLAAVGTGTPFLVTLLAAPLIPLGLLIGPASQPVPLLLVVAIAMAVTSIPVISKIMYDLGILDSRFARIVLGVAVIEDIVLWALLAVATALAQSGGVPKEAIAGHVALSLAYFGAGMLVMPNLLRALTHASWNPLPKASPVGYAVVVLLAYCWIAALLDINLVFAAFLAGYACVSRMKQLEDAIRTIGKFSFGMFIPVYFAIVGCKLDLTRTFVLDMLIAFMVAACAVKLLSVGCSARLAGFGWRDSTNLSVALNARGGPGIVLASVAFDAQIINAAFYTTLVLVAIITSQTAGAWLAYVIRKGWPLLAEPAPASPAKEPPGGQRPATKPLQSVPLR